MRFSTEQKYRKYVKGHGFLSFATRFGDKYSKKLMDTATKTGIDAAKTASKRAVQKTAKAIGDLIGNKIADQINSLIVCNRSSAVDLVNMHGFFL